MICLLGESGTLGDLRKGEAPDDSDPADDCGVGTMAPFLGVRRMGEGGAR